MHTTSIWFFFHMSISGFFLSLVLIKPICCSQSYIVLIFFRRVSFFIPPFFSHLPVPVLSRVKFVLISWYIWLLGLESSGNKFRWKKMVFCLAILIALSMISTFIAQLPVKIWNLFMKHDLLLMSMIFFMQI